MKYSKKYTILSLARNAFPAAMLIVCGTTMARADIGSTYSYHSSSQNSVPQNISIPTPNPTPLPPPPLTTADTIIPFDINNFEGPGIALNDNHHGVSHWGINSEANGLSAEQTVALTFPQAVELSKENYWDPMQIGSLPNDMRLVAYDSGIQFGVYVGDTMVENAHNDPNILLRERSAYYHMLAAENPQLYGSSLPVWMERNAVLATIVRTMPSSIADPSAPYVEDADDSVTPDILQTPLAPPQTPRVQPSRTHTAEQTVENPAFASTPEAADPMAAMRNAVDTRAFVEMGAISAPFLAFVPSIPIGSLFWRRKSKKRPLKLPQNGVTYESDLTSETRLQNPENDTDVMNGNEIQNTFGALLEPSIERWAQDREGSNLPRLVGFSDKEIAAFHNVYLALAPVSDNPTNESWRVDYDRDSHSIIRKNEITSYGDSGIKKELIYVSQAWSSGGCHVTSETEGHVEKYIQAARELIREGSLPAEFAINGMRVLPAPEPAPYQQAPYRQAPYRPAPYRSIFQPAVFGFGS